MKNLKSPHNRQFFQQTRWQSISDMDFQSSNAQWVVPDVAPVPLDLWWGLGWFLEYFNNNFIFLIKFLFKLQMRGTGIHLWLLNTGELACDLKSVISEAVSWKSSQNHNISFFNRTNNLPLIYRHVWFTLLDWIQFAIDDLISGHICFHSYHCCVYVWKVTIIQNFKLVALWIFCGEFIGVW